MSGKKDTLRVKLNGTSQKWYQPKMVPAKKKKKKKQKWKEYFKNLLEVVNKPIKNIHCQQDIKLEQLTQEDFDIVQ